MMSAHMTDPTEDPPAPPSEAPVEAAEFEVETETMADGRHIHYYRWPEADAPPAGERAEADV
jgi:hypothetical protein